VYSRTIRIHRFFDRPFDIILGHIGPFRIRNGQPQPGIKIRIATIALFYGHVDFLYETGKDFRALGIQRTLFSLDFTPFIMSGHASLFIPIPKVRIIQKMKNSSSGKSKYEMKLFSGTIFFVWASTEHPRQRRCSDALCFRLHLRSVLPANKLGVALPRRRAGPFAALTRSSGIDGPNSGSRCPFLSKFYLTNKWEF
jgi:hypothetical protein